MRKKLQLDIEDILQNHYLIADFIMIPELRKRLEEATLTDLHKLVLYLEDEKNVSSIASLFKSGKYKTYYNSKKENKNYDLLLETGKELSGVGLVFLLTKAFYNLVYNIHNSDKVVKEFINELQKEHIRARIEELIKEDNENE